MIKRFKVNFRTYHGVAGIIRRKTVFAVAFALVYGSLAIFTGFLLYQNRLVEVSEAYIIFFLLFVMGLLINGWLVLRMMRGPLEAIEHVEDDLVQMAQSGEYVLAKNHDPLEMHKTPFLQAYFSLLAHIDAVENQHLEFLAKLAHDIRSPVASILGYAELLTDSGLRRDEKFVDLTYSIIRKQGNQVCRLVEEAVMAAEVDAGRIPFQFAEFHLDEFLRCLCDEAREQYSRAIIFENSAGRAAIQGDAISLREAVLNLIDNAVKFSPPAQEVRLRLAHPDGGQEIDIAVIDRGVGIEEKDQPMLFRRFSKIRNDENREVPGSGLGLYIARKIVQRHSGTILVESRPGAGSTFTIRLPLPGGAPPPAALRGSA